VRKVVKVDLAVGEQVVLYPGRKLQNPAVVKLRKR